MKSYRARSHIPLEEAVMFRSPLLLLALTLLALWPAQHAVGQDDQAFQVIVNESVQETEIAAKQLSKIFLKKVKRWDDDSSVVVFDLTAESETRDVFSRAVHRKSISAIKSYWQRMIFSGRDVAPDELASEQDLLEQVASTPGAVGYVAATVELPDGVKALEIKKK